MDIKLTNEELPKEMLDVGFASITRIFQLHVGNEAEPEVVIAFPAGKEVNGKEMYYHVINETGYGMEPNGQYALLSESDLKKIYHCDFTGETKTSHIERFEKKELEPVSCSFARTIKVVHVNSQTFEKICPMISNMPIDVNFMAEQRYFNVITNEGLVIFKKIDR